MTLQLIHHILFSKLTTDVCVFLTPVGSIFGNLTAHLVEVHQDEWADRDWSHLKVRNLGIQNVDLQEKAQVHECETYHVHHGKPIDEAAKGVERAVLGISATNRILEEFLRDINSCGRRRPVIPSIFLNLLCLHLGGSDLQLVLLFQPVLWLGQVKRLYALIVLVDTIPGV